MTLFTELNLRYIYLARPLSILYCFLQLVEPSLPSQDLCKFCSHNRDPCRFNMPVITINILETSRFPGPCSSVLLIAAIKQVLMQCFLDDVRYPCLLHHDSTDIILNLSFPICNQSYIICEFSVAY